MKDITARATLNTYARLSRASVAHDCRAVNEEDRNITRPAVAEMKAIFKRRRAGTSRLASLLR